MKHLMREFKVEGTDWIQIQNDALKFLQTNNKKVNQAMILEYAANGYIEAYLGQKFREDSHKVKEDQFFFRPILTKKEFDINKLYFEYKTYYLDNDDLSDIKLDTYRDIHFEFAPNYKEQISFFIQAYISNFKFREKKEGKAEILDKDLVWLEALHKPTNNLQKFELLADASLDNWSLEKFVVGKHVGDVVDFQAEPGLTLEIRILDCFKITPEPVTDENAHKIGIENLKTVEDVKKYIFDSLMEQMVGEALFNYGLKVIDSIRDNNVAIELPQDLVANDVKDFNFAPDFEGNKEETVESSVVNYFWFNFVAKNFDISITQEELNYEIKRVKTFLNMNNPNDVNIKKVADAILLKKLAKKILDESEPLTVKEFGQYMIFK